MQVTQSSWSVCTIGSLLISGILNAANWGVIMVVVLIVVLG
jgi:hypothetical protein